VATPRTQVASTTAPPVGLFAQIQDTENRVRSSERLAPARAHGRALLSPVDAERRMNQGQFQASRVQYTSRHNGPLNGLKSNPRIELATAKTACRIITGTTTTF